MYSRYISRMLFHCMLILSFYNIACWMQAGALAMLCNWEENLAIITANRTKNDELVIIHLGDCLLKEKAEVCYVCINQDLSSIFSSIVFQPLLWLLQNEEVEKESSSLRYWKSYFHMLHIKRLQKKKIEAEPSFTNPLC